MLSLPKIGNDIIIRRPEIRDLSDWYELESDPVVKKFIGIVRKPRDEWIQLMSAKLPSEALVIEAKEGNQFAGRASIARAYIKDPIRVEDPIRELQIVISRAFWGRGFGKQASRLLITAAFKELGAIEVLAMIHPCNSWSRSSFEGLGFIDSGQIDERGNQIFTLSKSAYSGLS